MSRLEHDPSKKNGGWAVWARSRNQWLCNTLLSCTLHYDATPFITVNWHWLSRMDYHGGFFVEDLNLSTFSTLDTGTFGQMFSELHGAFWA